jgi:hypothetical protein
MKMTTYLSGNAEWLIGVLGAIALGLSLFLFYRQMSAPLPASANVEKFWDQSPDAYTEADLQLTKFGLARGPTRYFFFCEMSDITEPQSLFAGQAHMLRSAADCLYADSLEDLMRRSESFNIAPVDYSTGSELH